MCREFQDALHCAITVNAECLGDGCVSAEPSRFFAVLQEQGARQQPQRALWTPCTLLCVTRKSLCLIHCCSRIQEQVARQQLQRALDRQEARLSQLNKALAERDAQLAAVKRDASSLREQKTAVENWLDA